MSTEAELKIAAVGPVAEFRSYRQLRGHNSDLRSSSRDRLQNPSSVLCPRNSRQVNATGDLQRKEKG
jgi:hypothetical protein